MVGELRDVLNPKSLRVSKSSVPDISHLNPPTFLPTYFAASTATTNIPCSALPDYITSPRPDTV